MTSEAMPISSDASGSDASGSRSVSVPDRGALDWDACIAHAEANPHLSDDKRARVLASIRKAQALSNQDRVMHQPGMVRAAIERYESGESLSDVAASLGISSQAVHAAILKGEPERWKAALAARHAASVEHELGEAMDRAVEQGSRLALIRSRERLRVSQWALERVARETFGDAPAVQVNQVFASGGDVAMQIRELETRLGIASVVTGKAREPGSDAQAIEGHSEML